MIVINNFHVKCFNSITVFFVHSKDIISNFEGHTQESQLIGKNNHKILLHFFFLVKLPRKSNLNGISFFRLFLSDLNKFFLFSIED